MNSEDSLPRWVLPLVMFIVVFVARFFVAKQKAEQRLAAIRNRKVQHLDTSRMRLDYAATLADCRAKWSKPLAELPVGVDYPRLAGKIDVRRNGATVLEASRTHHGTMHAVLDALAENLDGADVRHRIREHFMEYFNTGTADDGQAMKLFVVDVLPHGCRTGAALAAINQAAIAPPVIKLKVEFGRQFPFKDVRGAWTIFVDIQGDRVDIVHSRWEQSFAEDVFQFRWEFGMTFDRELSTMNSISIEIKEVRFGSAASVKDQAAIQDAINRFNVGAKPASS